MNTEETLHGGNVSFVKRAGNTVKRSLSENAGRIHMLLRHLEQKGYTYSPRFIGIDSGGCEVLSFIEGEAGNDPMKEYMWSDESLARIAIMLRFYHDAVSDFPFDASWKPLIGTLPPYELICHNDFARYNIIFNGKEKLPAGIIDFDVAAPGSRLWDIAYTLYTCVPLSRFYEVVPGGKIDYTNAEAGKRKSRIALFFTKYGIPHPDNLFDIVLARLSGLCQLIEKKANEGNPAFQKMRQDKHIEHYQEDRKFIKAHWMEWV